MTELLNLSPPLLISESDRRGLLAVAGANETLLDEVQRARIAPDDMLPPDVVRMGSSVRYRTGDGQERTVRLVWPREADIEAARISVLTPVGAALIGLSQGQSISWEARNGAHTLTVLAVSQDS